MYSNKILSLSQVEDSIRQFSKEADIWATRKMWLLWADIHYRNLWKYGQNGGFDNYMKVVWGYQHSQAYKFVKAGCTIELLLNHHEFACSQIRLPDTLELAVSLGKHSDHKIFEIWQDCYENNKPIPPVAVNSRGKSKRILKIPKALEELNLRELFYKTL
jgi:hypothetical protein